MRLQILLIDPTLPLCERMLSISSGFYQRTLEECGKHADKLSQSDLLVIFTFNHITSTFALSVSLHLSHI